MVLDLKLPRRSGFEVLGWIRAQNDLRFLPVVVLTSSSLSSDIAKAYEVGANSYLVKTPDQDEFREMAKTFHSYWLTFNQVPSEHSDE